MIKQVSSSWSIFIQTDLSYLCIIITNYYDMYFSVDTHSVLCPLLSTGKFYVHSSRSL